MSKDTVTRLQDVIAKIDDGMSRGVGLAPHELLQVQFACKAAIEELTSAPEPSAPAPARAELPKRGPSRSKQDGSA